MRWAGFASSLAMSVLLLWMTRRARQRALVLESLHGAPDREAGRLAGAASLVLERLDRGAYPSRLKGLLGQSSLSMSWEEFRTAWLCSLLLLPAAAVAVTGTLFAAPLAAACAVFLPLPFLKWSRNRSRARDRERCERFASELALYLQTGMPLDVALVRCSGLLDAGARSTGDAIRSRLSLGEPPVDILAGVADSYGDPELELITQAVIASRETGSDIRRVMAGVGEALRERAEVRRELQSRTVQGRLSGRVVALLPFGFLLLSVVVSRDTLRVLLGTGTGLVMLCAATALDVLGLLWIRRILLKAGERD